jgi:hypothetical protein
MRATPMLALLLGSILVVGCDKDRKMSVVEPAIPSMDVVAGESWVLTTYYWDNGWVRQTAVDASFLPADLRLGFNAHNWSDQYPGFGVTFDNVVAYGNIDLPQGTIDSFDGASIGTMWDGGGGNCVAAPFTQGAQACLNSGALVATVDPGTTANGLYHIVSLGTKDLVLHGEFDVRIDFAVGSDFHSAPLGQRNVMLCVWDQFFINGTCMTVNSGWYDTWRGLNGQNPTPQGYIVGRTLTDDLTGKLRITRTLVQRGSVEESVTGSGSMTAAAGDWRTFSFTAQRYANGIVAGQWQLVRRQVGNAADSKSHGVVSCFSIVGNQAWVGGYATSGMNSAPTNGVAWRVADNGEGKKAPSPDQISAQYYSPDFSFPAAVCGHAPNLTLYAIEAGNIQIHP